MDGRRVNELLDKAKATNETNNLSTSQQSTRQLKQTCELINETSGGYCGGVPPLPIPNREVKPTCADGTAMQCGRVGSRLLSAGALRIQYSRGSFFCACPFSKSPPYVLQEVLFLSILTGSYHSLFIHLQGKGMPAHVALSCHLHPIPLAF